MALMSRRSNPTLIIRGNFHRTPMLYPSLFVMDACGMPRQNHFFSSRILIKSISSSVNRVGDRAQEASTPKAPIKKEDIILGTRIKRRPDYTQVKENQFVISRLPGETRGGDAGACENFFVLVKRVAVSWCLWLGFCLGKTRGGDAGACGKVFVLAKCVAVTQVLVVRFLSWQKR